jgi:hypothetical protein
MLTVADQKVYAHAEVARHVQARSTQEAMRRWAIANLGGIPDEFLRGRHHAQREVTPSRCTPKELFWMSGDGRRILELQEQFTNEKEWRTWSTREEPDWLRQLVSRLDLHLVAS